jgi:F0F1-type ATP synthase membrane subunit c/vacuolar-type H+-ATPase subunit K
VSFAAGLAQAGVVVATLVLSVLGGMLVTPWVLRAAARRSVAEGEAPPPRDPGPVPPPPGPPSPTASATTTRAASATTTSAASATTANAAPTGAPVPPPPGPPGPSMATPPPAAPDPATGATSSDPGGPVGVEAVQALRGGTWIGILERLAVTGCLLAGYPAGIAVVVAIKGLGRYPELREHPVGAERFLIGTLASTIWAGGIGLLGAAILGLLR